jgi:DNA-directed RNA polymerase specialized sigma24 family protein
MGEYPDNRHSGRGILGTTRWSLVRRATSSGAALNEWAETCWYPLYAWARHKRWSPEDAADAVQDFLGKICTRGLLSQADPSRGRFRSWLLTGFSNHLSSQHARSSCLKRGGTADHVSVDHLELENLYQLEMSTLAEPEQVYTRAWALSLMDEALSRLADHFKAGGREELFQLLLPVLENSQVDSTYEELAAKSGMSGVALRQAVCRFRQRYRLLLLDVAGERLGITSKARLQEELRELLGT